MLIDTLERGECTVRIQTKKYTYCSARRNNDSFNINIRSVQQRTEYIQSHNLIISLLHWKKKIPIRNCDIVVEPIA